jgi:hypothetical protein
MTNDKENDQVTRRAREVHPKGEAGHQTGAPETRITPPQTRHDAGPGDPHYSSDQTRIHRPVPPSEGTTIMHGRTGGTAERGKIDSYDRVTGWLVVVSGPGKGKARPIFEGKNSVGRDSEQRIPLDFNDSEISRGEHFFITYERKRREFLINDGVKANLVYLKGEVVLGGAKKLSAGDEIEVGQTKLRFVPLCGPDFSWDDA